MLDLQAKGNSLLLGMEEKSFGKIWIVVLEEVINPKWKSFGFMG